jgi:Tol biopolymer transport system component
VTLAALALALVTTGPAAATFPGRNGLIAFASDRDPLLMHPQIFSLNVRGGEPRNLTESAADDYDPAPSPDGRLVAFSRRGDIWLMNADGSGQRLLTRGGSHPTWSPNGKTIAFNGGGPGECPPEAFHCGHLVAVWTIRLDGSGLRRHDASSRNATWSPSGRRIAYEGGVDPYGDAHGIRVANADGTHARWVARAGAEPAWAPNGRLIAYTGRRGIEVVRPDGTGRHRLAAGGRSATWAPRGNRLAYACGRAGSEGTETTFTLCVISAAGRGRRTVARGVTASSNPAGLDRAEAAWSPRALRLAYVRPDGIFLVNADGRGGRRGACKERTLLISSLAWSGDGRRLSFAQTRNYNDLEIYTAGTDGSGPEPLTHNSVEDLQPSWAADGTQLAFVRLVAGRAEIWAMNADGTGQRLVVRDGAEPAWTSDGSRIVFTRYKTQPNSTYSVSVSTGQEELLVRGGIHGAPSPDGTKVAFVRDSLAGSRVFLASADGNGETFLASGGGRLSWSPDSTTLAFVGCTGVPGVCTIRVDGTGLTHVPFGEPRGQTYSFSPDGTAFTFGSGPVYPASQIEVSGIDGSGRRVITAARGRNGDPDWQPLPRRSRASTARPGRTCGRSARVRSEVRRLQHRRSDLSG